jgi:type I restriction enzyme M protein
MFQPSTGTQTSLLVLKKRDKNYNNFEDLIRGEGKEHVFLSVPRKIGHDLRGNIIPLRDVDGNLIIREITKKRFVRDASGKWLDEKVIIHEIVPYDDLPKVFEEFKAWIKEYRGEL